MTKWILPALIVCAIAAGCQNKKNNTNGTTANAAALDVPAAPAAPPTLFTPAAQQPVIQDAPSEPVASISEEPADEIVSAPAPQRAPAKRVASGGTRYKVKKGESLWSIAQAKYGNGNKWKAIAAANPKIDPNKVQAGQTIVLP